MFRFQLAKMSRWFGVTVPAAIVCAAGLHFAPAHAQEIDYGHVIDLVEGQAMLVEKMSKESLLIALDSKNPNRLATLKESHDRFNTVLAGLRKGNRSLGLPASTNPAILDRLAAVEGLWPLFDGAILTILRARVVGRGEIDTLAELNGPLLEALSGATEAYKAEAEGGQLHSVLGQVISIASQQRHLSQKIAKEFLLVAYNHGTRKNRSRLKKSIAQFDQSMADLLQGRPQQRLIAPPTLEIRAQLDSANQIWRQITPLLAPVTGGGTPGDNEILRVSELNAKLLEAVNQALTLYMAL